MNILFHDILILWKEYVFTAFLHTFPFTFYLYIPAWVATQVEAMHYNRKWLGWELSIKRSWRSCIKKEERSVRGTRVIISAVTEPSFFPPNFEKADQSCCQRLLCVDVLLVTVSMEIVLGGKYGHHQLWNSGLISNQIYSYIIMKQTVIHSSHNILFSFWKSALVLSLGAFFFLTEFISLFLLWFLFRYNFC